MFDTVVLDPATIDLTITGKKEPSGIFLNTTEEDPLIVVTSMSPPVPIYSALFFTFVVPTTTVSAIVAKSGWLKNCPICFIYLVLSLFISSVAFFITLSV